MSANGFIFKTTILWLAVTNCYGKVDIGNNALRETLRTIEWWYIQFNRGNFNLEDDARFGGPIEVTTDENIETTKIIGGRPTCDKCTNYSTDSSPPFEKKYFKICDRNSPDVNDCLVDAVQDGLVLMCDGIKELGIPAVDPYYQKELRVEYKNNQIAVKMTMKNILVYGLREAKVQDVRLRADEDNFLLEVDMTTPKVFVNGSYQGEGGWNALAINTTGTFNTTMKELVYTWKINAKPEKINDEMYLKANSFYMRPDLSDLKSYITNDDPATQEFTKLGNNFANANWKVLYRELLPYAQDNWNKIGIRIVNKLFLKVPYDQLFPSKS